MRTQEACQACLGMRVEREVLLGKRPEAVADQGRQEAHLGGSPEPEELILEEPGQEELHMSEVSQHTRRSGSYQQAQAQGLRELP
jgi:hypothetical protein